MLARLIAAIQNGELHGLGGQGLVGEGDTIVVDEDNCRVRTETD